MAEGAAPLAPGAGTLDADAARNFVPVFGVEGLHVGMDGLGDLFGSLFMRLTRLKLIP